MKLSSVFLFALLAAAPTLHARPLDAEGRCPAPKPIGSITRIAQGPFTGKAPTMKLVSGFGAAHRAGTAGDYPWLEQLNGKSGANRLYREGNRQVVVATVCDPADCDGLRAYVAFEPAKRAWGATVIEGPNLRELVQGAGNTTLAMHDQVLAHALLCAIDTDADAK